MKNKGKKNDGAMVPEVIKNKDVAITGSGLPAYQEGSPMAMTMMLLDKNVDLDRIDRIMEQQVRYDKILAEKAYVSSMASLKLNPPKIYKEKTVSYKNSAGTTTTYKHATIGNVVGLVTAWLAGGGFSVAWKCLQSSEKTNIKMRVTCTITHNKGHSDSTCLEFGPDTSGGKNGIQAIGSTQTYLERYTLLGLCGLATHDQDDDGKAGGDVEKECIDGHQMEMLRDMMADTNTKEASILAIAKVKKIEDIRVGNFDIILGLLDAKKRVKEGAKSE